jgi:hypothetical protein
MNAFSSFEKLCLKRFQILEKDFGLRVVKIEREHYGLFITYQNSTTFLRVSLEPREGGVFVTIGRLVHGRIPPYEDTSPHWFDFHHLLALRAPQISFWSGEWPSARELDQVLKGIVNALRSHAADVLQGDFTIFKQLHQVVKERAKRMKG